MARYMRFCKSIDPDGMALHCLPRNRQIILKRPNVALWQEPLVKFGESYYAKPREKGF